MTREDSLLTKMWCTNDGRLLEVSEIDDAHLRALLGHLRDEMTPERVEDACHVELAAWMADHAAGAHAIDDEMDHDLFRAGWIQIVNDEIARRST